MQVVQTIAIYDDPTGFIQIKEHQVQLETLMFFPGMKNPNDEEGSQDLGLQVTITWLCEE